MQIIRLEYRAAGALFLAIGGTADAPLADGLLGHLPLDRDALDVTGNGHHGEFVGAIFLTGRTPTASLSPTIPRLARRTLSWQSGFA